jgi:hypothetical protein
MRSMVKGLLGMMQILGSAAPSTALTRGPPPPLRGGGY